MPTSKARLDKTVVVDALYESVDDIPWEKLEELTGTKFSEVDRIEIFEVTEKYGTALCHGSNTAGLKDVLDLWNELISASKDMIWLIADCMYEVEARASSLAKHRKSFQTLQDNFFEKPNEIEDLLRSVVESNRALSEALLDPFRFEDLILLNDDTSGDGTGNTDQSVEPIESAKAANDPLKDARIDPALDALVVYLSEVVRGADVDPTSGQNQQRPKARRPKSYLRWGIKIGPRRQPFRRFSSVLLREQERRKHEGKSKYLKLKTELCKARTNRDRFAIEKILRDIKSARPLTPTY